MKSRLVFLLFFLIALMFTSIKPAQADGIIIPEPTSCPFGKCPPPPVCDPGPCIIPPRPHPISQLDIRYHHVTVKINDQIAVTHIDQVFFNPNSWSIEGEYVFPLPKDAAVSNFTLWIDGKPVEGKVLNADQARQTYEDIVRQMRDPALLEYTGRGAVTAHIFPIPSQGERRIELEYSQALVADNGLVNYLYPLSTEKFSSAPIDSVTVSLDINSKQPVRAIYSPSHSVSIDRISDTHVTVSYEASKVIPDTDFSLFYSIGEAEAFHLISYRDPKDPVDPDGFFMLLLAPKTGEDVKPVAKDVLLVLDRSGSMDGEKFTQAQSALRFILKHLNPDDRFYLLTFSSDIKVYTQGLSPANAADDAINWASQLGASGSTDINRALLESAAVADRERPTYLIFMTDGLPTQGVTDSSQILKNFDSSSPKNLNLFAFGVGYDVDTFLLDSLTQNHHGTSTYVKPGESLDEVLSGFYARISAPVMTNINLDFGKLLTYDLYPDPLPDLFAGSQVIVVGRYHSGGTSDITLKGQIDGEIKTLQFPGQQLVDDSRTDISAPASLPRLWATRKIGYLLNKIRLQGPDKETIDQIVHLSIRYGIVTPYTSYLVTEPMPLGVENQQRLAQQTYKDLQQAPAAPVTGAGAVAKAANEGALSQADVAAPVPESADQQIKTVGNHTFVYNNGIWVDTIFDQNTMKTSKVAFLSPDYFALALSSPEAGAALALGDEVIFVLNGKAYEVLDESAQVPAVNIPTSVTPSKIVAPKTVATNTPRINVVAAATRVHVSTPTVATVNQPSTNATGSLGLVGGFILLALIIILIFFKKSFR